MKTHARLYLPHVYTIGVQHSSTFEAIKHLGNGKVLVKLKTGEWVRPSNVSTEKVYERDSGADKVLTKSHNLTINNWEREIATTYDSVWAVDTNTKNIGGNEISVVTAIEAYFVLNASSDSVKIRFSMHPNILFKNAQKGLAEKVGWCKLIGQIIKRDDYSEQLRIALITDHDLGIHRSLNERERPIFKGKNSFLPENISLIYASDKGRDNTLNKFIHMCDKESTKLMRGFEQDGFCEKDGQRISLDEIPNIDNKIYGENS